MEFNLHVSSGELKPLSSNGFCSRCDPVVCDITDHHGSFQSMTSYGKKKRKKRSAKHEDVDPKEDDVMVAGVIHISDQFELNDKQDERKMSRYPHKQDFSGLSLKF